MFLKGNRICKNCKNSVPKAAKRCPKCGGNLGFPTWAKVFIIIGVILLCLVTCVGACSKAVVDSIDDAIRETKNEYNDINGKTKFKINESFQNKYEKITMTEINVDFKDYSKYLQPKEGYQYLMVKFEVENVNEGNDELYVSSYDFNATADGVAAESSNIGNDNYSDFSATLSYGKKAIGYVFYEIPNDAKKIVIDYNPSFWIDVTSIEFIVQE